MNESTRAFIDSHLTEDRRRKIEEFMAQFDDEEDLSPISMDECTRDHRGPAGPNEDLASCPECWAPSWCLRPDGESFGWHISDCSLLLRHEGYCIGGGTGHVMPDGWKLRG